MTRLGTDRWASITMPAVDVSRMHSSIQLRWGKVWSVQLGDNGTVALLLVLIGLLVLKWA